MAVYATSLSEGEYGFPGAGIFKPGERKQIPVEVAGILYDHDSFKLEYDDPNELAFRDQSGRPRYVGFAGAIHNRFGYGYGSIQILRALRNLGVEARVGPNLPILLDPEQEDVRPQLAARNWAPKWDILHLTPDLIDWHARAPHNILWTMYESNKLPKPGDNCGHHTARVDWAHQTNQVARVVVPCEWFKDVLVDNGVTRPIDVIPYGVPANEWPLMERKVDGPFTFFQWGALSTRKGVLEAIDAFQMAFPGNDDVRLLFKTQYKMFAGGSYGDTHFNDPRISIISENWTHLQLLQQLSRVHCMVWLSRGEGFGLPPLQAAMTGMPTVMTTSSGMSAYYDPKYFYGVRTPTLSDSPIGGQWYDPDVEHAAEQMQAVYNDYTKATAKAKKGAGWLRNNFSIEKFTDRVGAFLSTLE